MTVEVSSSQGRLFVLDTPQATPGVCGICGYGGTERRYLDPRLDFEFYGTLIFCDSCVMSMAQMFGFIEPAQALALERRVEEAERELVTLRAALVNLESLRESLAALTGVSVSRNDNASVSSFSDPVDKPDEGLTDEHSSKSDSVSDTEQPDSSESGDESGPDDSGKSVATYDPFADIRI